MNIGAGSICRAALLSSVDRSLTSAIDLPERVRDGVLVDQRHEVGSAGLLTFDQPDSFEVSDDRGGLIAADGSDPGDLADRAWPVEADERTDDPASRCPR